MAASTLLCVAVPHVVPWSFATCCLQIALEWLRQSRGDELSMIFSVWRFIFPSVFAFRKASKSYFLWLWRRDPVLEQASGQ